MSAGGTDGVPGDVPDEAAGDADGADGAAVTLDALDALAAEYVLGTLDADGRLLLERLLERDEALRALVVGWEARLQGLADGAPRGTPPEALGTRLRDAVRRALPPGSEDAATADARPRVPDDPSPPPPREEASATSIARDPGPAAPVPLRPVAATAPAAPATARPTGPAVRPPPADAATEPGWRAAAIAAAVIAASLLALLVGGFPDGARRTASAAPAALGVLRDGSGRPRYLVEIDAAGTGVRAVALDAEPVGGDASLQLWAIDGAAGAPRAVGLLPADPWSAVALERAEARRRAPRSPRAASRPGARPRRARPARWSSRARSTRSAGRTEGPPVAPAGRRPAGAYQPRVPGGPLNGPATRELIHPP